ncbi:MAG: hypothetical protein QOG77_88 [Solirubrobacteraceae bacterium]|jgi:hypothetical protein|nr:hypothetical protein [Solirubrobacteraceae bacterium]
MTPLQAGDLVTVDGEHGERDGIVFQFPSRSKILVAVTDPGRGAVMRTFSPSELHPRARAGEYDDALQALIRRTPTGGGGPSRGGAGGGGGSRGHTRAPAHRATGR